MEKHIEKKSCKWAKDHGWKHAKVKHPGRRGAFDRIFHKHGVTAYIEFKYGAGKLSKAQQNERNELIDQDIPWLVAYSIEGVKEFLTELDPG